MAEENVLLRHTNGKLVLLPKSKANDAIERSKVAVTRIEAQWSVVDEKESNYEELCAVALGRSADSVQEGGQLVEAGEAHKKRVEELNAGLHEAKP